MSAQNTSSSFFIDIPYPKKGQPWQDKRASLISELINSERQYAQHLYHFVYEYRVALADASSRNLIMNLPPATEELFSKAEPIYVLNLSFLNLLEKSILCSPNVAWEPAMALIGECFKHFITGIKTNYSDYAKSFPEGMNALVNQFEADPNIIHAIGSCQSNVGVTLIECLRSPMERISRYKSLLLMLLEVTPREHNDREDLVSAYININPMALAYRFFVVHQSYQLLQKINVQFPNLGLLNTNIGPLVPGVPSIPMDLKSPNSRYLVFHEDEMQCFNGTGVISCQMWLFTDCVMISMPVNANPVLFEFSNIKAVPAELPSSFLHSIIDSENNTSSGNISNNNTKINITLNVNENSSDNCADFFTDIDSFRVIFNEAKRRDVFIEACSNLRIDMMLDEVDSEIDQTNPLAPIWTNLQDVTDCMLCGRVFGIVTQRFHCDYCRKVFCKRCINNSETNHVICRKCEKNNLGDKILPHMNINYKIGGFFNESQQKQGTTRKRTYSLSGHSSSIQQYQQQQKTQQRSPQQSQPLQQQPPPHTQLPQHPLPGQQRPAQQTQQAQPLQSYSSQPQIPKLLNPPQQSQQQTQKPQIPPQQQQFNTQIPHSQQAFNTQRSQMPTNLQQTRPPNFQQQQNQQSQQSNPQQQQNQQTQQSSPQQQQQQQQRLNQQPYTMPSQQQRFPQQPLSPPQPGSSSQMQQRFPPQQQQSQPQQSQQQQIQPQRQMQQSNMQSYQRAGPQSSNPSIPQQLQQKPFHTQQSQPTIPPPQLNQMPQQQYMQQRPQQPGQLSHPIQPQGVQQFRQMPQRPGANIAPAGLSGFNPNAGPRAPGVPNPQQVGAKLPQNMSQQQQMIRPVQIQQFQTMQPGQVQKPQTPPSPK